MTENGFCVIYAPRQAAQDLALQPGTPVTATVKASAVHLISR
jgi:molybdopterin-binding protein